MCLKSVRWPFKCITIIAVLFKFFFTCHTNCIVMEEKIALNQLRHPYLVHLRAFACVFFLL